jgi:hypothetical protein
MFESTMSLLKKIEIKKKIQKDYEFVTRVTNSSINYNHITVSTRMFENFLHKWRYELNETKKNSYCRDFSILKSKSIENFC